MSLFSPRYGTPVAACLLAGAATAQTLDGIELRTSPRRCEVVLGVAGQPDPRTLELDSPDRVVLDLVGTKRTLEVESRELAEGPVERVRVGQFADEPVPILRIVADLRRSCRYELQWIEGGLALVLWDAPAGTAAEPAKNQPARDPPPADAATTATDGHPTHPQLDPGPPAREP